MREAERAAFNALCTATSPICCPRNAATTLDHHLYLHLSDGWVQQSSQPQLFVSVTAMIYPDDYASLRFKAVTSKTVRTQLSAMADTGCQSCVASLKVVRRLSVCEGDLVPVTMRMHAANNNGIRILGAVVLRFSGHSKSVQPVQSRQVVYVTSDADKPGDMLSTRYDHDLPELPHTG